MTSFTAVTDEETFVKAKAEINAALNTLSDEKEIFKDFLKDADIRFYEYLDYSYEQCLTIFVVVADGKLHTDDTKDILGFYKEMTKPVIETISRQALVKKIALNYYVVNIFFKEVSEIKPLTTIEL